MKYLALDAVACVLLYVLVELLCYSKAVMLSGLAIVAAAMTAWRALHARTRMATVAPTLEDGSSLPLPYTCGFVSVDGKQLFVVATVHISPRAPKDVEAVIGSSSPDLVMIELDEERLTSMRHTNPFPREADLQPIEVEARGWETRKFKAQRAYWNAEHSGATICGPAVFEEADPYGVEDRGRAGQQPSGRLAVVRRGAPAGQVSTFTCKAHVAACSGADAVLVINHTNSLPAVPRIGAGTLTRELKDVMRTRSCGYPPIPLLLLPSEAGEYLVQRQQEEAAPQVKLSVLADDYPRRSLRRRLCQELSFALSGFCILYGIIECCRVDAGDEFLAADTAATARNVPCACIDVDTDKLCSRLASALVPTPCNIWHSLRAWLAFPRLLCGSLFPMPDGSVDVVGATILHARSFRLKTWVAMGFAALCAGAFMGFLLMFVAGETASAAADAGVVPKGDAELLQSLVMLVIELYVFPRLYDAVAASRDESMYQAIVSKARDHDARRLVVVVGAAHANGILQRAKTRGLAEQ